MEKLIADKNISQYQPNSQTINQYLNYLYKHYGFGDPKKSGTDTKEDIQAVFDIAIRPVLHYAAINADIELYSFVDHFLFSAYICPFEDTNWFQKSFWNVNYYGSSLADNIRQKINLDVPTSEPEEAILLVFKGPFVLAHSKVVRDFLDGVSKIKKKPKIHLLLLDQQAKSLELPSGIKVISFWNQKSLSSKLYSYIKLTTTTQYMNIIWIACVQNLMLYMGLGMSKNQTYWTMKRHSIVHKKINKYATVVSAYRNKIYNNAFWFGGRYRLKTVISNKSKIEILTSLSKEIRDKLRNSKYCLGSLARPQKYMSLEYWIGIESLLRANPEAVFIYGAKISLLPNRISDYICQSKELQTKSINFGWLGGKTVDVCSLIDIYVDNIPFASGLTASECVWNGGVYIGTLSEINKESSFINILADAYEFHFNKPMFDMNFDYAKLGITNNFAESLALIQKIMKNKEIGLTIRKNQIFLLKRMHDLGEEFFAVDYLNYFME